MFGLITRAKALEKSSFTELFLKRSKKLILSNTKIHWPTSKGKRLHEYQYLPIGRVDKRYTLYAIFVNFKGGEADFNLEQKFLEEVIYKALDKIEDPTVLCEFPARPVQMNWNEFVGKVLEGKHSITVGPLFWEKLFERNNELKDTPLYFILYFQWAGPKQAFTSEKHLKELHRRFTTEINPEYCSQFFMDLRASLFANLPKEEGKPKLYLAVVWNPDEMKKLFSIDESRNYRFQEKEGDSIPNLKKCHTVDEYNIYGTSVFRDVWCK
jgi:hypothetical protein